MPTATEQRARRAKTAIRLADDLRMPLDAVTETFGVFGQRGTGKSTTGAVLVEQIAYGGGRNVIFDPTGVWWGLTREGTGPGLPGVVLGGEHADAPLEPLAGKLVAEFVIASDYPVVVLDMKLMRKHQRQHFAMECLETLYHDNRDPLMVVLDEGQQFAPTQMREGGDVPRLLGAVEDVVKLGRSRGLGCTMIEQRLAALNANVREQIASLIAHGLVGPLDRKAFKEWVNAQGEPEREAEAVKLLSKLAVGQAVVWSPRFLKFFGVVQMDNATTYDSRATPKVGQRVKKPGKRTPVDLDTLMQQMNSVIEEAAQNDPKLLKQKMRDLERKLDAMEDRPTRERAREMADEIDRLTAELADRPPETVEVPVVTDEQIKLLETILNRIETGQGELASTYDRMREVLFPLSANVKDALQAQALAKARPAAPSRIQEHVPATTRVSEATDRAGAADGRSSGRTSGSDRTARPGPEAAPERGATGGASIINPSEQKVLDSIAWYEALGIDVPTKQQVALVAGYKSIGGRFGNLLGSLRSKDLVAYPSAGLVQFTSAGLALAEPLLLPHDNEAVQQQIMARLTPSQRKVLGEVLRHYPNPADKQEVATACDYTAVGGRFGNLLGSLRSLGLVEYPGPGVVRAREVLFPLG